VEHHFLPEFAHSGAPEVWLGYLASRTSTIRLGHGVVLLEGKINHPIRVAERIATLDIMSNGRVEFGTGRSAHPWQIEPFGCELAETRDEWAEAIDIIPKMWASDWFSHKGKFWNIPERNILPKPVQKPHPPLWVACAQPDTFELAGRKGVGALCFTLAQPGQMKERIDRYRNAIATAPEQAGMFKNNQVGAFTVVYCDDENQRARDLGGPNALWYYETLRNIYDPVWMQRKLEDVPPSYRWHAQLVRSDDRVGNKGWDYNQLIDNGSMCVGDPDHCIRTIEKYEVAGADQLLCFMQVGRIPHEKVMNSIRLFGKHVIPYFTAKARRR
jgi:alkanesulfonate monooxygenase SsuD/methylene tetrahydromethanopterin reductase-like flavin-dependent oxidoreductase (luciferase family)